MSSTETFTYRCPHCHTLMDIQSQLVDQTVECVNCRRPFLADIPSSVPVEDLPQRRSAEQPVVGAPVDEERVVQSVHPAMFRNHPFLFMTVIGVFLLGVVGLSWPLMETTGVDIGEWDRGNWTALEDAPIRWISLTLITASLLYLLAWWVKTRFISLQITTQRSLFQRGLIARSTSEVRHDDVRNLRIDQTIIQRLLGVGTLAISSSGQDDFEIRARGIPRPDVLAETIRNYE